MNLIENLKWRYATKAYNNIKVTEEKVDQILEAINLSASSCGLQSYRVFVVSNPEIQKKLGADSYNGQICSCSHLLVFAALTDMSSTYIDDYMAMTEKQRGLDAGALSGFFLKHWDSLCPFTPQKLHVLLEPLLPVLPPSPSPEGLFFKSPLYVL